VKEWNFDINQFFKQQSYKKYFKTGGHG